ncbi:sialidase 3 (membrane sialidase), tandem duplicate 1 isoform X1 [Silurus meridionalis]|nr:sialidase 3 (membrane sialidase), tandem duplicate 1 isoform X1 [Silurus meridionalis]
MENRTRGYSQILQAKPRKTTLFRKEINGITYRIPALIYMSETQTFLAFAEKRASPCDHDAILLVMRRGTQQDGSIRWSPVQELSTACLPGHRTMNPCPVYEKETKTLFLFFICVLGKTSEHHQIHTGKNKARLCYVTSSDNGQSWTSTIDLTESVIGHEIRNWATFAVGPGHGIQMKSGRLIIPAYVYYIHCRCFPFHFPLWVTSHAFAFYSDDCGVTWQFGERVSSESCECEMAEIVDQESRSELYCNARSSKGHRVEALSKSSGAAFDRPHVARKLVEPSHGCQGSVVSFSAPEDQENCLAQYTKTWLLYSHPTDRRSRKALGVYLNQSPLSISGWSKPWIIHQGPSGYSDLTSCQKPGQFSCLMECGKKSELEEIAFVEFSLCDIMQNQ